MNNHVGIAYHPLELTEQEIILVSGGSFTQGDPNEQGGQLSGMIYAIASGAAQGGVSAAIMASYMGQNWAHAGLGGMITGGVVGALNHVRGK